MESDRRATADDEECKHHLVNRRVLFPSPSAPIGLRGHGGRSSSSSYFIRSPVHAPPRAMLSLRARDRRGYTTCICEIYVGVCLVRRVDESTGRRSPTAASSWTILLAFRVFNVGCFGNCKRSFVGMVKITPRRAGKNNPMSSRKILSTKILVLNVKI